MIYGCGWWNLCGLFTFSRLGVGRDCCREERLAATLETLIVVVIFCSGSRWRFWWWWLMTVCHSLFWESFYMYFDHKVEFTRQLMLQKSRKLKKIQRRESCHDLVKTWHDFRRSKSSFDIEEIMSRWHNRGTIWGNPNSAICDSGRIVPRF